MPEIFVPEIDDDIDDIAQTVRKEEKKQRYENICIRRNCAYEFI